MIFVISLAKEDENLDVNEISVSRDKNKLHGHIYFSTKFVVISENNINSR